MLLTGSSIVDMESWGGSMSVHGVGGFAPPARASGTLHSSPALLYAAAQMYYEQDATQAEIATKLGTSRVTVSRLLAEARRQGIVRIQVIPPRKGDADELADRVAAALQLQQVHVCEALPAGWDSRPGLMGRTLAPAVCRALTEVGLLPGDVLLVAAGRTIYEVSEFDLPPLPGVIVAPTIGGTDQSEAWYQSNEIVRRVAERIGGRPVSLFAPALPGHDLLEILHREPIIQRVLQLWPVAHCLLTGVGAPPALRRELPHFIDRSSIALAKAIGDVCSRFFDRAGAPVEFPESERLLALTLDEVTKIPAVIAVASGQDKVLPILTAARAGFFNRLVTDPQTAETVLARATS